MSLSQKPLCIQIALVILLHASSTSDVFPEGQRAGHHVLVTMDVLFGLEYIWHNCGFNLVYSVPSIQFEFLTTAESPELTVASTYLPISKRKHCSAVIKYWDSFFLFSTLYVYVY